MAAHLTLLLHRAFSSHTIWHIGRHVREEMVYGIEHSIVIPSDPMVIYCLWVNLFQRILWLMTNLLRASSCVPADFTHSINVALRSFHNIRWWATSCDK